MQFNCSFYKELSRPLKTKAAFWGRTIPSGQSSNFAALLFFARVYAVFIKFWRLSNGKLSFFGCFFVVRSCKRRRGANVWCCCCDFNCWCAYVPSLLSWSLLKCNHCLKLFSPCAMMLMRDCDGDILVMCQFEWKLYHWRQWQWFLWELFTFGWNSEVVELRRYLFFLSFLLPHFRIHHIFLFTKHGLRFSFSPVCF